MGCLFLLVVPILGIIAGRTAARRGYLAAEGYLPTVVVLAIPLLFLGVALAYIQPHVPFWFDSFLNILAILACILIFRMWLRLLKRWPAAKKHRGIVLRLLSIIPVAIITPLLIFILPYALLAPIQRQQRNTYQWHYYGNTRFFESNSAFPAPDSARVLFARHTTPGFDRDSQIILAASLEHVDALRHLTPWPGTEWRQGPFSEEESSSQPLTLVEYLNGQTPDWDSDSLWLLAQESESSPNRWHSGRVLLLDTKKGLIWLHRWTS